LNDLLSTTSLGGVPTFGDPMKDDFKVFLYVVWKSGIIPGDPDPTRSQYEIADWLQHGPKRLVIEAFRGIGKSWVTSAFVCWLLYRDPQLNIMVVSASKERADNFSTFTLRLINELPFLAHLIPREGQRNSKISFDVGPARPSHSPSVKSVGITGQLTGSRADVIIADDVEVPGNAATTAMRDKLSELVKEFTAILKPLDDTRIIYLGTPQTEQSLYNRLPERGYEVRVLPARYPTEAQLPKYGDRLAGYLMRALEADPSLHGKPTCERFNEDVLMECLAEYAATGFALQFMLDTSLSDAERYPLKLHDLIVMDVDGALAPVDMAWGNDPALVHNDLPNVGFNGDRYHRPFMVSKDWLPYSGVVMAIDPSGRGSDETGYAVVAMLHGRLFVLDAGGLKGGYSMDTLEALAQIAKRHRVNTVIVEPNFGDGMFNQLLAPVLTRIHPCALEETERSNSQKERRIIDTLEPVMNQHRLVVDRSLIERDYKSTEGQPEETANRFRLFYQMTRLTKDRGAIAKDDRIDALALAVHYWTEQMSRDTEKAAEQARAEALEAELLSFMDNILHTGTDSFTRFSRSA
jgi:hypothetical protein